MLAQQSLSAAFTMLIPMQLIFVSLAAVAPAVCCECVNDGDKACAATQENGDSVKMSLLQTNVEMGQKKLSSGGKEETKLFQEQNPLSPFLLGPSTAQVNCSNDNGLVGYEYAFRGFWDFWATSSSVSSLQECADACSRAPHLDCVGFAYRYYEDTSLVDNCYLSGQMDLAGMGGMPWPREDEWSGQSEVYGAYQKCHQRTEDDCSAFCEGTVCADEDPTSTGMNQMLSCKQACAIRVSLAPQEDCVANCNRNGQSGCSLTVNGESGPISYSMCSFCDDWTDASEAVKGTMVSNEDCERGCSAFPYQYGGNEY